MKRFALVFAATALVVVMVSNAYSGDKVSNGRPYGPNTVASLLMGIRSDNQGLRESAAFVLGEIKCTEAVIPLMRLLHEDENASTRIVAALALSLIGESRGVYAVKRAVTFDSDSHVRLLCAYFYNQYGHPRTFAFVPSTPEISPALAGK
jgi:hypothetical protein